MESTLQKNIMLAIGKLLPNVRIFRNNVGTGWVGKSIKKGSLIIIENPRPLRAGLCEGSSDLIGWTTVEVTPEMVGKKIAVFTAIEIKTSSGSKSDEQVNFITRVREAGGIAGIARSEQEATQLITNQKP